MAEGHNEVGKWSMLDVFVVAVIIVLLTAQRFVSAHLRVGIYLFGTAIILSMLASAWVEQLARKVPAD